MKKNIIVLLLILSNCTVSTPDFVTDLDNFTEKMDSFSLEETDQFFPYLDMKYIVFIANGTEFSRQEKENILLVLDLIKLVFNDPEFLQEFKKQFPKLISKRNKTSSNGKKSIKIGDSVDHEIVIDLYRKLCIPITLSKVPLDPGVLGTALINSTYIYLENIESKNTQAQMNWWTAMSISSRLNWNSEYRSLVSLGGVVVHEAAHLLGFNHINKVNSFGDVAYAIGYAFEATARKNQKKYEQMFKKLNRYHQRKFTYLNLDNETKITRPLSFKQNIDENGNEPPSWSH